MTAPEQGASGPTKEAMVAALKILRAIFGDSAVLSDNEVRLCALAIDAHTQALRAENAILRERLRLAVEALRAWLHVEDNDIDTLSEKYTKAVAAGNALRASGVEI